MKFFAISAVAAAIVMSVSVAQAQDIDCGIEPIMPEVPETFVDEAEATNVGNDVKAYVKASEDFRECLLATERAQGSDLTPEFSSEISKLHDGNIDNVMAAANRYNAAVKTYKESNPE